MDNPNHNKKILLDPRKLSVKEMYELSLKLAPSDQQSKKKPAPAQKEAKKAEGEISK